MKLYWESGNGMNSSLLELFVNEEGLYSLPADLPRVAWGRMELSRPMHPPAE